MADQADVAQEIREEDERIRGLQRKKGVPGPRACGACHNCDGKLIIAGALFCDADCRDDWQGRTRQRAMKLNG